MEELGDGSRDKLGALSLLQLSQAADVLGETPIAVPALTTPFPWLLCAVAAAGSGAAASPTT